MIKLIKYLIQGIIKMRKHIFFKIVAKKIPKAFPNRAINSMFYNLFYSMFYNLKNMLNHVYFLPEER